MPALSSNDIYILIAGATKNYKPGAAKMARCAANNISNGAENVTIDLSRRGPFESGSFERQSVSPGTLAVRNQDEAIIKPGLAPKHGASAGHGIFLLRDAKTAARNINKASSIGSYGKPGHASVQLLTMPFGD